MTVGESHRCRSRVGAGYRLRLSAAEGSPPAGSTSVHRPSDTTSTCRSMARTAGGQELHRRHGRLVDGPRPWACQPSYTSAIASPYVDAVLSSTVGSVLEPARPMPPRYRAPVHEGTAGSIRLPSRRRTPTMSRTPASQTPSLATPVRLAGARWRDRHGEGQLRRHRPTDGTHLVAPQGYRHRPQTVRSGRPRGRRSTGPDAVLLRPVHRRGGLAAARP